MEAPLQSHLPIPQIADIGLHPIMILLCFKKNKGKESSIWRAHLRAYNRHVVNDNLARLVDLSRIESLARRTGLNLRSIPSSSSSQIFPTRLKARSSIVLPGAFAMQLDNCCIPKTLFRRYCHLPRVSRSFPNIPGVNRGSDAQSAPSNGLGDH